MAKNYYKYEPSMAAAVIFIITFSASSLLHAFQILKTRTWFFIPFLVGGGKVVNADTEDDRSTGENIIIGGLVVQIIFFSLFMIVTCLFHFRIRKNPTARAESINTRWELFLVILYITSILILIRSLFRLVEYAMGHDSELQSKEVYIYVLDAAPMLIASTLFNIFHPSKYLVAGKQIGDGSDSEMQLADYDTAYRPVA
ncbi:hypothetical protein Neosp_014866 [[Neocosmospora] mangrovei]